MKGNVLVRNRVCEREGRAADEHGAGALTLEMKRVGLHEHMAVYEASQVLVVGRNQRAVVNYRGTE